MSVWVCGVMFLFLSVFKDWRGHGTGSVYIDENRLEEKRKKEVIETRPRGEIGRHSDLGACSHVLQPI